MKKNQVAHIFETGICERSHSKMVIVRAISGMRGHLVSPVHTVAGGRLQTLFFDGVVSEHGCVCLTGVEVPGRSLLDIVLDGERAGFDSGSARRFLSALGQLFQAAFIIMEKTSKFPSLLLNGCYIDEPGENVTFFHEGLSGYLCSYLPEKMQKAVHYVSCRPARLPTVGSGGSRRRRAEDGAAGGTGERTFTQSCARLVYLFFNTGLVGDERKDPSEQPVYYLAEIHPGFPEHLADMIWDLMKGRAVGADALACEVDRSLGVRGPPCGKVPLFKRRPVVACLQATRRFFSTKVKPLVAGALACGLLAYFLAGFQREPDTRSVAIGLMPEQVVQLYLSAVERLDLDTVDALFTRRAGRKLRNELAALYVMHALESRFPGSNPAGTPVVIEKLEQERLPSESGSVAYRIRYNKTINTRDRRSEYHIEETLRLEFIAGRWCITRAEKAPLGDF